MMQGVRRWLLCNAPVAALCALTASAAGLMPSVAAAQSGPVSPHPATNTPALAPNGTIEQIRQVVACNGVMYAVGSFTRISQGGQTFTRDNIFSFSQTSPYKIKSWGHSANGMVDTILRTSNDHLFVGGQFTSINGSSKKYYVSLNLSTGKDDGYLNLNISGHYVFTGAGINHTEVYNQQLSPDKGHVLVQGTFTKVQRNRRQQICMLNLGNQGNVSTWYSNEFNAFCANKHPFYVKSAAWSADQSTVYIADTGKAPKGWDGTTFPLTGLCDAVAAFPALRNGGLSHEWVNYTGCDSLYSVAADPSAVYIGGHQRWANNQNACNQAGPGAIPAQGLGGFTLGGKLLTNSAGTRGRYSRDRGLGADQIYKTPAGIWIASDNQGGSDACGGVSGL